MGSGRRRREEFDVTYGEYRARCSRGKTFRTTPPDVEPKATYDNSVRRAVLDRILDDGMSVERVIASMRRDFLLDLSDGFVYDCLDWQARRLDLADHRRWVLDRFSGTFRVDELHLGRMTLLLATDPLQDLPVAFARVAKNDSDPCGDSSRTSRRGGSRPRSWSPTARTRTRRFWPNCGRQHAIRCASSMS